jgi:hypothetical protein
MDSIFDERACSVELQAFFVSQCAQWLRRERKEIQRLMLFYQKVCREAVKEHV